ncbi:hypothetical protein WJX75_004892 [Coccomyxa subellipsoidea]|uniref:Integrase zinc-binding domain-containing protein n=1 Tax=Coccomyxa subellipsoidea TaxID=248742 RepID=A0ABR2Z2Y4_9CHLO
MWRCSIEGSPHPVKTVTDHLPLTYLPTKGLLRAPLSRLYWWPTWRKDVTTYVQECSTSCQRNKPSNLKPAGTLRPLPIPGTLWESLGMDFITHLPKTRKGAKD